MAGPDTTPRDAALARAHAVFASLWAVAALFETALVWGPSGSLRAILALLLVRGSALWVLARPTALAPFAVLNGALVVSIYLRLPKMNNHGIFVLLVAATVLLALARARLARGASLGAGGAHAAYAPYLRWSLLAMYFWAVVHKLNVDFFSPDVSCGPMQLENMERWIPFLPSGAALQYFSIYGTLVVEAAIPLLLVFRRTRYFGIALAAGFHFFLGTRYTGFSAMLFAMLSLFAPPSFYAGLAERWRALARIPRVPAIVYRALGVLVAGTIVGFAVVALFFPESRLLDTGPPVLSKSFVLGAWIVVGLALIGAYAWSAWPRRPWVADAAPIFRLPYAALALLPLLVFANGLLPHVGLKNTQAFAMFSNLHTGGGRSNHLFIPASWQVFDLQSDLVRIVDTNDPVLRKLIGPSWRPVNYFSTVVIGRERVALLHERPTWRLPWFALRRRVSEMKRGGVEGLRITYERDGEVRYVANAELDPELSSVPHLPNKLLMMRAIQDGERGFCMW